MIHEYEAEYVLYWSVFEVNLLLVEKSLVIELLVIEFLVIVSVGDGSVEWIQHVGVWIDLKQVFY